MVATNKLLFHLTSLMNLALLNLHACPVTLAVIQDEKLPVAFEKTVSFTCLSDLCLRLAIIGSCCYDVPACAPVNIYLLLLVVSS